MNLKNLHRILDVAVVHGLKPYRETILAEKHQVYVTSYATFRQDSEILSKFYLLIFYF